MSTSASGASPVPGSSRSRRLLTWIVIAAVVVAVAYYAIKAFVTIYTKVLWFHSVGDQSIYTRELLTQVVMFAIFGALAALSVAVNLIVVIRFRPTFYPHPTKQRWRYLYLSRGHRWRWWLLILLTAYFTVSVGSRAAGAWQTWLLWRNAVPFHQSDPQFHRDISYYLFIYPMHRLLLTLLFRIIAISLILVLITAYMYGGIRLRGPRRGAHRPVIAQVSVLLGLFVVVKAFAYWLDRFGLATSNRGVVTGAGYTDVHAVLPDKMILLVIAALVAVVLFANVRLRRARLALSAIGAMAVAAFVFGIGVPALVQQFRDKPSASTLELPYIGRNITATRAAFGISNTSQQAFTPVSTTPAALRKSASGAAQYRLLDPNQFSSTFTAKQQIEAYYGFKSTLDVDHYPIDGKDQNVILAVRELTQSGLPNSQKTWTNTHLVYTHGNGIVAAPTNQAKVNEPPNFVEKDLPSTGSLAPAGSYQPEIYYGQMSPSYSIVDTKSREFDLPPTSSTGKQYTNYVGGGGISIGSVFRRLVFSLKFHSASLLLSSDIQSHSQLLTIRNPRARVAAVAPWLTLDGDVYPVVSGGHILWVVDGYTTANTYPYSQQENLKTATSTTLTQNGSSVTQPGTSVNYMRNSVKATVDAYSGKVTLYEWNQGESPDPVLKTWEKAFPGLVQQQSTIPSDLLSHLRYPQDLFNMQRYVLTQYHVTNPTQFYSGSDFWKVPTDPTIAASTTTNAIGKKVAVAPPTQPSTYMTLSPDGVTPATYDLSSSLVSLNKRTLSAFLTVDAQPGPGYGGFTLLKIPASNQIDAPSQVQADIEGDQNIQSRFALLRNSNSQVVYGNQLAVPLGGQILYVEPTYTQSTGSNSFPIFLGVIARYGSGSPVLAATLTDALDGALGAKPASAPTTTSAGTTSP